MFAYCGNNPVMGYDPEGFDYCTFSDRRHFLYSEVTHTYGGTQCYYPNRSSAEYDEPTGTLSLGLSASAFGGVGGAISGGAVVDWNLNLGLAATGGVGYGTPSIGTGIYVSTTNAPNIDKLNGPSSALGGSINVLGYSVGIEYTVFSDSEDPSISYDGWTVVVGEKGAYPVEIHGYTATSKVWGFNFYDLLAGHDDE